MVTDPARWARIAVVLTFVWLVTDVGVAAAAFNTIVALGGTGAGIAAPPVLEAADRWAAIAGGALFLALVGSGFAVLRWIYLTNRNAHAWSTGPTITPGWAAGWFFVPVASLWKPFQAFRETWQASVDPDAPDTVAVPALMRWWWGAWIASTMLGNLSFRLSLRAKTPDDLITACWIDIVTLVVDVPLALSLVALVRELTAIQAKRLAVATRPMEPGAVPA